MTGFKAFWENMLLEAMVFPKPKRMMKDGGEGRYINVDNGTDITNQVFNKVTITGFARPSMEVLDRNVSFDPVDADHLQSELDFTDSTSENFKKSDRGIAKINMVKPSGHKVATGNDLSEKTPPTEFVVSIESNTTKFKNQFNGDTHIYAKVLEIKRPTQLAYYPKQSEPRLRPTTHIGNAEIHTGEIAYYIYPSGSSKKPKPVYDKVVIS